MSKYTKVSRLYLSFSIIYDHTTSTEFFPCADQPWQNDTTACEFPEIFHPEEDKDNSTETPRFEPNALKPFEDLDRYLGTYGHYVWGEVQVYKHKLN